MAQTAIAVDGLEALQISLNLAPKIPFDDNLLRCDRGDDGTDLFGREFFGPGVGIDVGLFQDTLGGLGANAVNINERGFNALVAGDFYAEESWHDRGSVWCG